MATNIGNLDFWLVAASAGGVASFFRGFRIYRQYLLLQGTSEIPIRSIAMGLVRIHGKATSDRLVTSPISHTPCCVWQVHIEKWRDENEEAHRSGVWLHYGSETDGAPFYLEDNSGRVLVDPRGADYDIERTAIREASSAKPSSVVVDGASEMDLLSYVARVGPSEEAPGSRHNLEAEQMMFAASKYAKEGNTPDQMMRKLFPQVMQGEAKMVQDLEAEGPLSDPRREEVRLAMIELYKLPFWDPKYEELRRRIVKMQARNRKLGPFGTVVPTRHLGFADALPQLSPPRSDVAVPVANPPAANPPLAAYPPSPSDHPLASGRYRLTERCILPGHEYDITGTCSENPEAKDADDRNLIRKGTNQPTFLISGLAQPEVNTMLQMRAYLMIFGGGILAVCCVMLLLLRLGQF